MEFLGFTVLTFVLYFGVSDYLLKEKKRIASIREFISFFEFAKMQMQCFLTQGEQLLLNFNSDLFEKAGFSASEGNFTLLERFNDVSDRFFIKDEESRVIKTCLAKMESGYLESVIEGIEICLAQLTERLDELSAGYPKNKRITVTVTVTLILGLLIYII